MTILRNYVFTNERLLYITERYLQSSCFAYMLILHNISHYSKLFSKTWLIFMTHCAHTSNIQSSQYVISCVPTIAMFCTFLGIIYVFFMYSKYYARKILLCNVLAFLNILYYWFFFMLVRPNWTSLLENTL